MNQEPRIIDIKTTLRIPEQLNALAADLTLGKPGGVESVETDLVMGNELVAATNLQAVQVELTFNPQPAHIDFPRALSEYRLDVSSPGQHLWLHMPLVQLLQRVKCSTTLRIPAGGRLDVKLCPNRHDLDAHDYRGRVTIRVMFFGYEVPRHPS